MSLLNSLFDVVRGWIPENASACIEENFVQNSAVAANNPLTEGDVVAVQSDGTVNRATGADFGTAAGSSAGALAIALAEAKQLWLVVSGSSDEEYDGLRPGGAGAQNSLGHVPFKCTCIKGTYMFETEKFVTRAYQPGHTVTVISGEPDLTLDGTANSAFQPYGEVLAYDAAAGLLTLTVTN